MNKIKLFITLIKQLFSILTKKQRQKSIGVFIFIVISSFLEMLSISALIPFFYTMLEPEKIVNNKIFIEFSDIFNYSYSSFSSLLVLMGVMICSVFFLKACILLFSNYYRLNFQNLIMKESALTMLSAYLKRSYQDMLDINSSEAVRDINVNTTSIYYILQSIFYIIISSLNLLSVLLVLCKINISLTLELFILAATAGLLILSFIKKKISKSGVMFNEAMLLVGKYAYEALNGLKEINVNNINQSFIDRYETGVELKRKAEARFRFLQTCPSILLEVIFIFALMIIVCYKILNGQNAAEMVPELATIAYGSLKLLGSISIIVNEVNNIIYYKDSFNSAYNALKAASDYEGKKELSQIKDFYTKSLDFNKIEIKKLNWRYKCGKKDILNNLYLTINKGESIGFIGPSGAGKSTLADIILGILEPQDKNVVLVDGIDVFSIRGAWANTVGYIPQNVFLLDDTIKNNIIFGRNHLYTDDSQIWGSLEQAQLKDFVMSLPDKLDTVVGERGVKFSGGQRQRVAIARALFGKPNFLVLDEATSALDNETEQAVMEAIEYLQGKITLLIIAHRLSTISKCDKVYEIKDGKAIEVKK